MIGQVFEDLPPRGGGKGSKTNLLDMAREYPGKFVVVETHSDSQSAANAAQAMRDMEGGKLAKETWTINSRTIKNDDGESEYVVLAKVEVSDANAG